MAPAPAPAPAFDKPNATSSNLKFPIKRSPPKGRPFNKPKNVPVNDKTTAKPTQQPPSAPARSSKPIINWLQRKLVGSGRAKRAAVDAITAPSKGRITPRGASRVVSSPVPSPRGRQSGPLDAAPPMLRKTISLNEEDVSIIGESDSNSLDHSSLAPESTWSPGSVQEADEDASLRPIPPSAPPSPSPSPSSSSYASDPRTFRSTSASTKPTTVLSLDIYGNGMAHIAQVPTTPPTQYRFPPHVRTSSSTHHQNSASGASVTFSSLPQSSSRPSSAAPGNFPLPQLPLHAGIAPVQAPLHTAHHPRNNPRPSSPPWDNASVLTLASSAYAIPGLRPQLGHSTTPSARGIGDSVSHVGGSITYADAESASHFILGDDERLEERDVNASVRALRPRSSRRGSWESEVSRWSARDPLGAASLIRDRSLRTSYSLKTGPLSPEPYERSEDVEKREEKQDSLQSSVPDSAYADANFEVPPSPVEASNLDADSGSSRENEAKRASIDEEPLVDASVQSSESVSRQNSDASWR